MIRKNEAAAMISAAQAKIATHMIRFCKPCVACTISTRIASWAVVVLSSWRAKNSINA